MKIVRGKYSEYKGRLDKFFHDHCNEIATLTAPDIKLDIDDDFYMSLENNNSYVSFALMDDSNNLIGYLAAIVYPHPHHKQDIFAMTDVFYIDPKVRSIKTFKLIVEAFKKLERTLREEYNAKYLYINTNANRDLKRLAINHLKAIPAEVLYLKQL